MKSTTLVAALAAASLFTGATWTVARAQVPAEGTVYALHSGPTGSCPALDWHLVTGANGSVNGMVSWDNMKSMAHVEGTIGSNRAFTMTATETGGAGRTATVTGQSYPDGWLIATIKGATIYCPDVKIPVWNRSGSQGGGGHG